MAAVSSFRSVSFFLGIILSFSLPLFYPVAEPRAYAQQTIPKQPAENPSVPGITSFEEVVAKASSAREQGLPVQAIQNYEAALRLRPDWPDGWWYLGSLDAELGRYPEAISAFKKLVEVKPEFGPGWASLGLCEFETKNYEDSFAHLTRSQELGFSAVPEEEKAGVYHLALLLNRRREFESAWELLASKFRNGIVPQQVKLALALALLRVPLLPDQVDPSKDALLDEAGETAAFLVQGNFDPALPSFRQILSDYPDTPFLHYAYGSALMFRAQYDLAREELLAETRIVPNSALPHMRLAVIALKEGRPTEALPDAKQAVELAHDSALAHEILGRVQIQLGRTEEGAAEAALAAKLKPEKPQPDPGVAEVYSVRATALDRQRPETWVELALSEFEHKEYKNAYLHLERGRELGYQGNAQQMTIAVTRLAELRNFNGDFFGAGELLAPEARRGRLTEEMKLTLGMSMLRVARLPDQLDPSGRKLVHDAGETSALVHSGRYRDAFLGFEKLLKDYPGIPYVHYAYAAALDTLSRYDEAEAQLREEIKITPQNSLSPMRLASIELKQHRPEQALNYGGQAVQLDPLAAGGHELMGRALLDLDRVSEAITELEIARKLAPNYPEVHFNLARAYARAKRKAEADQERALFVQLNAAIERERSAEVQAYGAIQTPPEPRDSAR